MTVAADLQPGLHEHYRELLPDGLSPVSGGIADGYVGLVARVLGIKVEAATRMVLDWLPQTASAEALDVIGAGLGLRRFPSKPLETWRRVVGAYDFWSKAGTLPGVTLALAQAGYRAVIVEHFKDSDPTHWAEFSIALSPLNPIKTPWKWVTEGKWGQRRRWGGLDPNAVPLEYLLDLVREVKPAHARLRRLAYSVHGWYWGGDLQWGQGRIGQDNLGLGWGLSSGVPFLRFAGSSDNGPTWGGDEGIVLYDLYNEGAV